MTGRLTRARIAWEVRRSLGRSPDASRELEALRRHARERSPLLRSAHGGTAELPLEELPILTKDELVDRFDELVTDPGLRLQELRAHVAHETPGTRHRGYWLGVSSGSGGRPVVLPFSRREWSSKIVNAARARQLTGARGGGRSAKISSPSAWHLSLQVGSTLSDPRRPTLRLSATAPLDEIAARLEDWRPEVLAGYPSVIGALADAQLRGDLHLGPTAVLCGGESLSDAVRRRIEVAWGTRPHDQYVTTEAGFVASECEAHDGMHVLDDVVVEVVGDRGEAVSDGSPGSVLVTVLRSRTIPLVRYRLDDTATIARDACACGRTTPRLRLLGRHRELLRIPHAGGVARVHPVVFSQVLDARPLHDWQVVHREGRIELVLRGAADQHDAIAAEVGRALADATGAPIPVTATEATGPARSGSGKASRIVDAG